MRPGITCTLATITCLIVGVEGRPQHLACPLSIAMFSATGRIAFDVPAAAANHFGTLVERNAAGVSTRGLNATEVGRHLRSDELPAMRGDLSQNGIDIRRPGAARSWRIVWGYTIENASQCMAGALVLPQDVNQHEYALTIPATASIERVSVSRLDTASGREQSCGSWSGVRAMPSTFSCDAGEDRASFTSAPYAEPSNATIARGGVDLPSTLLEAGQGLRFNCAVTGRSPNACRLEIRWTPEKK